MSNVSKTLSYLKRNGIKNTCFEILQRFDKKNVEEIQRQAAAYKGSRYFCEKGPPEKTTFQKDYLFSIVVPAYETNPKHLREMIDSVFSQRDFARVELIIADAGVTNQVEQVVKEYQQAFRIKYVHLKENKGISENTNAALELAEGDYVGLLDHDDVLLNDALYYVRLKLEEADYELLYSDEDKGDSELTHFFEPHFKPDFNLDYLLSNNYICHFLVMKTQLMKKLGFRKEYDGAQDYDITLRAVGEILKEQRGREKIAHIPKVLYHWRCHESSTASNPESKRYAYEAGKKAVEDFLKSYMNMGKDRVTVSHTSHLGFYKVQYKESVFQARPEVAAVCGRVIEKGKVTDGPLWHQQTGDLLLFKGLKAAYGGYMHRAEMMMQVDGMPQTAVIWNKRYRLLFKEKEKDGKKLDFAEKQQIARQQGDIFLYLPDFSGMKEKLNEDLI